MGRDLRQEALTYLLDKAEKQGYVTFDDIMDCGDANDLPIQDFDWLSSAITTRGILVYDEAPNNIIDQEYDDDYDDYAQSDYESVYRRIIELDDSLEQFVTDIRKIKPPQWREFSQLKYQVIEGNQHARERMIEMHLRVALKIALQRAEIYDMDIQDAVGEACIGLVIAVDKYNPDTNGAFSSYASMWILQNITRKQPTQRPLMHYSVHKKDAYFSAYPTLKAAGYVGDIDVLKDPDMYRLLEEKFSFTNEQTKDIINATIPFESYEELDAMFLGNSDVCEKHNFKEEYEKKFPQGLIMADDTDERITDIMIKEQLHEVLNTLKDREKQVLSLRFGLNGGSEKTLEEVGVVLSISRERVRQIERNALQKLRHPSWSSKLEDYINFMPLTRCVSDDEV